MFPLTYQDFAILVCLVPRFGIFVIGDMVYLIKIPSTTIMLICVGVRKGTWL